MKVFNRLRLIVNAAVKDIPSDLKSTIEKHWYRGGMKSFLDQVYCNTNKDLNSLEMSPDTFTKTTKLKEKDISDVVSNGDKILIINVFDEGKDNGIFYLSKYTTDWVGDQKEHDKFELSKIEDPSKPWKVDYRNVNILGKPRNVPVVLNWPGITYKAWIIDLSKAKDTQELRNQRYEAQKGIVQRYKDAWGIDKSGYKVDKSKYVKMLKELKRSGNDYIDRISKISAEYFDAVKEFQKKNPNAYPYDIERAAKAMQEAINASVDQYSWESNIKINEKIDAFQRAVSDLKKKAASM